MSRGGEAELIQLAKTLVMAGCIADLYPSSAKTIDFYDYVMHFSIHPHGFDFLDSVVAKEKKILLWPTVWWTSQPAEIEDYALKKYGKYIDKFLFRSEFERQNFLSFYPDFLHKSFVLPICVNSNFTDKFDLNLAKTVYAKPNYLISIGVIEPIKNQLTLIECAQGIDVDLLFVGGHEDDEYYRLCKNKGGNRVTFLSHLMPASSLLISLMANSRGVVELSYDPPGRSILEATLLRRPALVANGPWCEEYFGGNISSVELNDFSAIKKALISMLSSPNCGYDLDLAYKLIISEYSLGGIASNFAARLEEILI
jgi:glycosyltransferase involved in cell wall biosynthesis